MKRKRVLVGLFFLGFTALSCQHAREPAREAADLQERGWPVPAHVNVEQRVDDLLGQLTLDEKLSMIAGSRAYWSPGVPRLGIPELKMTDGPIGTHNDGPSTAYPSEICLAASWDTDLARQFGAAQGRDGRARDDHIILGPAMNIYRVPVDGRNSEYMGEDPYLTGTMAGQVVDGIQSQGVVATIKHFAANNQEDRRETVSAQVSEQALREIYLRQFQIAVAEAHPWAVMAALNKINGVYCSANHWLLTDVLKGEWGFPGLVMSDFAWANETLGAANAGLDLEMPSTKFFAPARIKPLIASGEISMTTINDKVRRILRAEVAMGFINSDRKIATIPRDDPTSRQTALKIAEEGIVLLKNRGGLLPLDPAKIKRIAVIGPNADPAITGSGGSSYTVPFKAVSTLKGIQSLARGVEISYIPGRRVDEIANERQKIAAADAAIVCVGFNPSRESEGFDRTYALPGNQNDLISQVEAINPRTIVIINAGGNVEMAPWIEKTAGVIQAWYPGEEGGKALAEIIFGRVNPSGQLPATFEKKWANTPAYGHYPGRDDKVDYAEGIFVGYRWFDHKGIAPRYPFGYGLSYTSFALSDLKIGAAKGHPGYVVSARVKNTGDRAGAEVAQFYVGQDQPTLPTPPRKLAGFAHVELLPGQSKTVHFTLDAATLAYWHPDTNQWSADSGGYHVWIGESSRDLPLSAAVEWPMSGK